MNFGVHYLEDNSFSCIYPQAIQILAINATRHEKIVLCIQNLTTFLSKHSVSMKLLLLVKLTIRNPMQLTELVYLAQKIR